MGKPFLPVLVKVAENIVMTNEMHFFVSRYHQSYGQHCRGMGAGHWSRQPWVGGACGAGGVQMFPAGLSCARQVCFRYKNRKGFFLRVTDGEGSAGGTTSAQ